MEEPWTLSGDRVLTAEGLGPAKLTIAGGLIHEVELGPVSRHDGEHIDDAVIFPGIVDVHVHVNDPGRSDWEGFDTATRAAAAGGVTTIVDMPLNSIPPTTTVAGLRAKQEAAAGRAWVDYGFWGGAVPTNLRELGSLADAGALGFKCFLADSGVDEFSAIGETDLREAMSTIQKLDGSLLAHAEWQPTLDRFDRDRDRSPRTYASYLATRPSEAETDAIARLLAIAEESECRVHIVHLATADALTMIAAAKARGVRVTVETAPHYLTFCAEEIADGTTQFKCAPPIRDASHREALWEALRRGEIDFVATDHSPCPPAMKRFESGDFFAAWGGVASLGLALPVVWTEAQRRGFDLGHVARWLCEQPAEFAGLSKGRIDWGYPADLIVWRPEESFVIDEASLNFRHPISPYLGRTVSGRIDRTYLRGELIYHGQAVVGSPRGRRLERGVLDDDGDNTERQRP